jgi:hypothetical protein
MLTICSCANLASVLVSIFSYCYYQFVFGPILHCPHANNLFSYQPCISPHDNIQSLLLTICLWVNLALSSCQQLLLVPTLHQSSCYNILSLHYFCINNQSLSHSRINPHANNLFSCQPCISPHVIIFSHCYYQFVFEPILLCPRANNQTSCQSCASPHANNQLLLLTI